MTLTPAETLPFDECPICERLPRKLSAFLTDGSGQKRHPEHEFPGDPAAERLVKIVEGSWLRRCPLCGTTYQYDQLDRGWPSGSLQTYLYRLTPAKLRRRLSGSPLESYRRELRDLEERFPALTEAARRLLSSPKGEAREHGAESLVDDLKVQKRWDEVRELLRHADARVRLGALRSFEDFHFYGIDVGLGPHVPDVIDALADSDPDVAYAARMLLENRPWKERKAIRARLRKVPKEAQSVAHRLLLLELADSLPEIVAGLVDPSFEVWSDALTRLHRRCSRDRDGALRIKEAIRGLGVDPPTEAMEAFLSDDEPHLRAVADDDD